MRAGTGAVKRAKFTPFWTTHLCGLRTSGVDFTIGEFLRSGTRWVGWQGLTVGKSGQDYGMGWGCRIGPLLRQIICTQTS